MKGGTIRNDNVESAMRSQLEGRNEEFYRSKYLTINMVKGVLGDY